MPKRRKGGRRKSYQTIRHHMRFTPGSKARWRRRIFEVGTVIHDDPKQGVIVHIFRFKKVNVMAHGKKIGTSQMIVDAYVPEKNLHPLGERT